MRTLFKWIAILALPLMMAAPAWAQSGDVAGRYNVRGTNFGGGTYKGTATIEVTSQNTCRIYWKIGGDTAEGICMRNGDAFSAAYKMSGKVGLVIYRMNPDGSMEGLWTIADQNGVGTETLIPR